MTPKEKAEELAEKFFAIEDSEANSTAWIDWCLSIHCAQIAVDEIISNRERIKGIDKLYWQQVKHEIEKL